MSCWGKNELWYWCVTPKTGACKLLTLLSIWVEVCCGFFATYWFGQPNDYYDKKTEENEVYLIKMIFFIDSLVGIWLWIFTIVEIAFRFEENTIKSTKWNWLVLLSSSVTIAAFIVTFTYKREVLGQQEDEGIKLNYLRVNIPGLVITDHRKLLGIVYVLPIFYTSFSAAPIFRKVFPFILVAVWLQMGIPLMDTDFHLWKKLPQAENVHSASAYAIFSVDLAFTNILFGYTARSTGLQTQQNIFNKEVVSNWVWGVVTAAISAAFGLIWAHSALVVFENGLPILVTNVLAIYIYSIFLLTLLQCNSNGVEENSIRDGLVTSAVSVV